MCCNRFRIILMFAFTILAFILNSYLSAIPVILWYLISINIFTFILLIIDKYNATKNRKRVAQASLYFLALAGGFLGTLLAMLIARHKIRDKLFVFWQTLIAVIWVIGSVYVINHSDEIKAIVKNLLS